MKFKCSERSPRLSISAIRCSAFRPINQRLLIFIYRSSSRVFISGENLDIPIDIKTAAVNDVLLIDKVIEINQNKL
jgi:hypothetical protein